MNKYTKVRAVRRVTLVLRQALRYEDGFILPWALVVAFVGIFVAVPVAVLAGSNFLSQGKVEDATRNYYAADALVQAIIQDFKRGADGVPLPPSTYNPPTVTFGEAAAAISVQVAELETLATFKPIAYKVSGNPTLVQGANPLGSGLDLDLDDNLYYKVDSAGSPPVVAWEVTSQVIEFSTVSSGEVIVVAKSDKSSTKLEVFIHNPSDPTHTQGGYNPIADLTEILDVASTEETVVVSLEDADVAYLNSQATSTRALKVKIKATRTGGFKLHTDRAAFSIAGMVTTDRRSVAGEPQVDSGSIDAGSGADLKRDDTSYFKVNSTANVVRYQANSENFAFSALDTLSVTFVVRSTKPGVVAELYVYNPTDPAHTNGGYDPVPDLATTIPVNNTDKTLTLQVSATDIAYLNTLFPISMKVKVRATHTENFRLDSDMLVFVATDTSAPGIAVKQITQQYIDPGLVNPAMAQINPGEGYLLRMYTVRPGLAKVSWASHTSDFKEASRKILVFRGLVVDNGLVVPPGRVTQIPPSKDNDLVLSAKSRKENSYVQTAYSNVDTGLYTIVFFNESVKLLISEPFAATGDKLNTWIYMPAFKDYIIDIRVGKVGLKAVVRQIPGPTEPPAFPWSTTNIAWIENTVSILSWEPYGVP